MASPSSSHNGTLLATGRDITTEILPVRPDAIHEQVGRIVQSRDLHLSELQQRFLRYLVEQSLSNEAGQLKEYSIGLDFFGKPPSYDPRQESVVGMHVLRLRQKLAEYYHTEGANDPILIDIPKGGFSVHFEDRPTVEADGPVAPAEAGPQLAPRRHLP